MIKTKLGASYLCDRCGICDTVEKIIAFLIFLNIVFKMRATCLYGF
jgi:hypothetical protein